MSATEAWDLASGPVEFTPESLEELGPGVEGLDSEYTVFRHRASGAAVEIVHEPDDASVPTFFRVLTAEIFDIVPSSGINADFAEDCPGHVIFANAHISGEFLRAKNLYHALAAAPGARPFSEEALLAGNWTVAHDDDGAGRRVLAHPASNWTVRTSGPYVILQHTLCAGSQLVLTPDGVTFLGTRCPLGYLHKAPSAIAVSGAAPPARLTLAAARARLEEQFLLPPPDPAALPPLRASRIRGYLHSLAKVVGGLE